MWPLNDEKLQKQQASICMQQAATSPQQSLAAKARPEIDSRPAAAENLMILEVMECVL